MRSASGRKNLPPTIYTCAGRERKWPSASTQNSASGARIAVSFAKAASENRARSAHRRSSIYAASAQNVNPGSREVYLRQRTSVVKYTG